MINVLVVEDDAMVAEFNRYYLSQVAGFNCCGIVSSLQQAREFLMAMEQPIDLIL